MKNIFAIMGLLWATLATAQNPNDNLWKMYISHLTSAKFYQDAEAEIRAKIVMQDNEFEPNTEGYMTKIYTNPLLLDGKTLNYGYFDLFSTGVLTLAKGKPETTEAAAIPFYVSIRRDGKIIENKKMSFKGKMLYQIPLSDIFPYCKDGDLLIIKPAKAEDWRAKRILKLMGGC